MVRAYSVQALAVMFLGDFDAALRAVQAGEEIARKNKLNGDLAMILSTRAQMAYYFQRDAIQAQRYLDEAAQLESAVGYGWDSSLMSFGMARVAGLLGDLKTARAKFNESIEFASKIGNRRFAYSNQSEFAHILREQGVLDEALGIYRDLLPKWKEVGHRPALAHELECIAFIMIRKEKHELAANLLGAAQALRESIDSVMTKVEEVEYQKETR